MAAKAIDDFGNKASKNMMVSETVLKYFCRIKYKYEI